MPLDAPINHTLRPCQLVMGVFKGLKKSDIGNGEKA
jgi:hypothetical protein